MSGYWQATGTTSVTISAPAGAAAGGEQVRIRGLSASVASSTAITITDSVLSAIIWQVTFSGSFVVSDLDVRGSVGANLAIALTLGTAINVEGDYVPIGYPYGLT